MRIDNILGTLLPTAAAVATSEQTTTLALKEISTTEIHDVPIHLPYREHAERTLKQDESLAMAFSMTFSLPLLY